VVLLQIILGGSALVGLLVLQLNKTPGEVADERAASPPPIRQKPSFAKMVRDPNAKNGSQDDKWRKALIGTWRLPLDDYAPGEITYASTGAMSGRITLETGGRKKELIWSGTWDVKEGRLCEEIEESNTPDILPVGRKTKDKIIEGNEEAFRIFDAEISETVTMRRIE
jgi:hypothetical protein